MDINDNTTPPVTPPETPPAKPNYPEEPSVRNMPAKEEAKPNQDEEVDLLDTEKAKQFITNQVQKGIAPASEALETLKVEQDLSLLLAQNPEYKPYEDRIRKWVNHPNRIELIKKHGLPVETVALEAVAPFLQEIGAEKAKRADQEALGTQPNSSSARPKEAGKPDYANMPLEEFTKLVDDVKYGRAK